VVVDALCDGRFLGARPRASPDASEALSSQYTGTWTNVAMSPTPDPCVNGINPLSTLKLLSWIEGAQRGSDVELIELTHGPSTSIIFENGGGRGIDRQPGW
jgi:hypothetical protein